MAKANHDPEVEHREILDGLARAVRTRRAELGLTVREVAQRSGLSERFIGLVEAGEGNPALTRLVDLSRALGCGIADLVPDEKSRGRDRSLIAMLGLRGAGKTTVGRALARRMHVAFVELDARVEAEAGLRLGEIFALHGESYYRRMEVAALRKLLAEGRPVVVATGGGVVTNAEALEILRRHARTVWLRAPVDAHWARVVAQGDRRPMAGKPQARAELDAIYGQRAPLYARAADIIVDTAALDVDEAARRIQDGVTAGSAA